MKDQATKIIIFGWTDSVHVERWARGLIERGYRVKIVSPVEEKFDGIDSVNFPDTGKMSYLKYASAAAREARLFKPDIVHVHYAGGLGLWGLKTKLRPLVVSVWGSDVVDLPSKPHYRWLIKRVLRKATHVTATSRMLMEATVELQPSAMGKITVVPFGVNVPDRYQEQPEPEPVKICFAKNLKLIAGPDILLRAMTRVVGEIPDVVLNIAGTGEATGHVRRMIAQLNLTNHVNMVGFIENDRIYSFYQDHHFMVMPSVKEAFGVAALESLACGRPVVASKVGGIPEVLVDNETGILVDKGDPDKLAAAIIRLARDAALRERMGRAGHQFVKDNFTWERSLDLMVDVYNRVLHEQS